MSSLCGFNCGVEIEKELLQIHEEQCLQKIWNMIFSGVKNPHYIRSDSHQYIIEEIFEQCLSQLQYNSEDGELMEH